MIVIGIRYLTGYAVASTRVAPEWPPHPGRIFMAMAAAHFETGGVAEERDALERLEAEGAPALSVSGADLRSEVRAYVPVNDDHGGIFNRPRQDRAFHYARPYSDTVYLIWPTAEAGEPMRRALEQLCAKVTRVGHSSSVVQTWLLPDGSRPEPTLVPDRLVSGQRLRVAGAGTLKQLEGDFNADAILRYLEAEDLVATAKGKELSRLKSSMAEHFPQGRPQSRRPQLTNWQGYRQVQVESTDGSAVVDGPFDANILILSGEGSVLGLESTLQLTGALRRQALAPDPKATPEWLSGHQPSGEPSREAHVAFFPLPFVGDEHGDGHVMGLGMAIPRGVEAAELQKYLGPLFFDEYGEEQSIEIERPATWKWALTRETRERPPKTLRTVTWTGPSRFWATVTPIVLHHHPKKRPGDVERIVREAFVSALLPEPESVRIMAASYFTGAGHVKQMPPFEEGGRSMSNYQVHALVDFGQMVGGPVLVGRGRFRGYGLMRPLTKEEVTKWRS